MMTPASQPFGELVFIKKFSSKRNTVYLVERDGKPLVLKLYDNDRWRNEADVLEAAAGAHIPVPAIVEVKEKALLLGFIQGKSANDYLETERMRETALGVAQWLGRFHRAFREGDMVRIRSDAIFKNFIFDDHIYGIDFELSRMGRPEEDVGETLAYLLDAYPMFTPNKFTLAREFIECYEKEAGQVLENVEVHIARSLRAASEFRPAQREILIKKALDIEASRPFIH